MAIENVDQFVAVGRRKSAVARVRIKSGTGIWVINGKTVERTKLSDALNSILVSPLKIVDCEASVDFSVNVNGGGEIGQAHAISLGLARALEKMNPDWRCALKKEGLLTRDGRCKERKKPGRPGARKRFQFSKR